MNPLTKEKVCKRIAQICVSGNDVNAGDVLKKLTAALRKAKKTHTNIKIGISGCERDEWTLSSSYIILDGYTTETEEEWHSRLDRRKYQIKREIENAERVKLTQSILEKEIEDIDKAIQKTTLRCVDCNKPTITRINSSVTNGKTIRICNDCHEKRRIT